MVRLPAEDRKLVVFLWRLSMKEPHQP